MDGGGRILEPERTEGKADLSFPELNPERYVLRAIRDQLEAFRAGTGPEMEIRQRRGIADQAVVVDASDTATRHLRQP